MKNNNTAISLDSYPDRIHFLALIYYVLSLVPLSLYLLLAEDGSGLAKWLFLITSLLAYPLVYLLPACLGFALTRAFSARGVKHGLVWFGAFFCASAELLMGMDLQITRQFGFHVNGLVLNLLFTRGGFESMGLGMETIIPAILMIIFIYALYFFLAHVCLTKNFPAVIGKKLFSRTGCWICSCLLVFFLLFSLFSTGVADFYSNVDVLTNQDIYPVTLTIRMRSFMKKLGCKAPSRQEIMLKASQDTNVNYPLNPIVRDENRKKYNIIWLVMESLRWDMLDQEIMPNCWKLSQEGLTCENHYSGGNGTRAGVFSLFYGLYALNWDNFLNHKEPPIFFHWLQDDGYQFLCQTSAKFTYPEFDKTVFAAVQQEDLLEQSKGSPVERDDKLIDKMLDFIDKRDPQRPFFTFGFFESTHAPYSFPEDNAYRKDYLNSVNYNTVTKSQADGIFARYVNSAHFLDRQLARILDYLDLHPELKENTIVILAGDHGEEFFENGRLGHNSTFSNQQTRPLFTMRVPGRAPRRITRVTQHTDLIATLAPLLGVRNSPGDFCVGQDLYSDEYNRDTYLICGWEIATFLNDKYKATLPLGKKGGLLSRNITHRDDSPCTEDEVDSFFTRYAGEILQIQKDLNRFVDK